MKPNKTPKCYWIGLLVVLLLSNSCQQSPPMMPENTDWEGYLGGAATNQYSSLDQINTKNVHMSIYQKKKKKIHATNLILHFL